MDSGNQGQIFEYSASNIRAHLVKPKPDFLNIRQTRIEVLGGEYSIFPSLVIYDDIRQHSCIAEVWFRRFATFGRCSDHALRISSLRHSSLQHSSLWTVS